jgi:hypothetical protein
MNSFFFFFFSFLAMSKVGTLGSNPLSPPT